MVTYAITAPIDFQSASGFMISGPYDVCIFSSVIDITSKGDPGGMDDDVLFREFAEGEHLRCIERCLDAAADVAVK